MSEGGRPYCLALSGKYSCALDRGHEGPDHIARGASGRILARWDVVVPPFVPVVAPQLLAEADAVRAREARRRVYAQDERRKAARALDRYIAHVMGDEFAPAVQADRAIDFVQEVGDYVLSRLQQKSDYGARPGFVGPNGAERPGEHWNARLIREQGDGAPPACHALCASMGVVMPSLHEGDGTDG